MKQIKNNSIDNLYKKGANESTPTALDNLILNQAKQSCEAETSSTKVKPRRWIYSLATAAVFVMGFSMIINLQNINQEMQVAPQTIGIEKKFEVEFKADDVSPLEPHRKQRLNKQNAPAKYKAIKPKPIKLNELKKDSREAIQESGAVSSSLVLETIAVPVIATPVPTLETEEIPLAKITGDITGSITDGDLGLARGNISNSPIKEDEKEERSVMADSVEAAPALEQLEYDQQGDAELDRVVVTGSRIRSDDLRFESNIPEDIQKLAGLITHKRFARAKKLLEKLKKKYPNYDFTELELLIKKSS